MFYATLVIANLLFLAIMGVVIGPSVFRVLGVH
jgi:hypothetical protein